MNTARSQQATPNCSRYRRPGRGIDLHKPHATAGAHEDLCLSLAMSMSVCIRQTAVTVLALKTLFPPTGRNRTYKPALLTSSVKRSGSFPPKWVDSVVCNKFWLFPQHRTQEPNQTWQTHAQSQFPASRLDEWIHIRHIVVLSNYLLSKSIFVSFWGL